MTEAGDPARAGLASTARFWPGASPPRAIQGPGHLPHRAAGGSGAPSSWWSSHRPCQVPPSQCLGLGPHLPMGSWLLRSMSLPALGV